MLLRDNRSLLSALRSVRLLCVPAHRLSVASSTVPFARYPHCAAVAAFSVCPSSSVFVLLCVVSALCSSLQQRRERRGEQHAQQQRQQREESGREETNGDGERNREQTRDPRGLAGEERTEESARGLTPVAHAAHCVPDGCRFHNNCKGFYHRLHDGIMRYERP